MSYLDELNEPQRAAVEKMDGPSMVIAGAGSGKTRVLTYRIAHLIANKVDPFNILALTFTNKAAKEMKARIGEMVGDSEAKSLWMGTFHSVFARILRFEADKLNYPTNFTIYDTQDSRSLIRSIIKQLNLDDKIYKPAIVQNRISAAKNNLISAKDYQMNPELEQADKFAGRPLLGKIYNIYAQRCFNAGAMDFDDLLFNTNRLFRDFPDALHKYQRKFKYVLVDEYQDTNHSQYIIVKKLAAMYENITVVGDDAQSIYSFRGANIQNILNFQKDYPDLVTFKLEQNYRSTQVIVNAANSIISNNKKQIKKEVWTSNDQGEKIKVTRNLTDGEEGSSVAHSIFERKMNEQASNLDFAILYRTNAQSRSFEESLRKMNIKYKVFGGLSFYQRKEIKDLLAYFRLTANHNDEESLRRVINYPARGIGATTQTKIWLAASENNVSVWEVLLNLQQFGVKVNSGTAEKLTNFANLIRLFSSELNNKTAYDLGFEIAKTTGMMRDLSADKTPEGISRYENIQELLNGLKEFGEQAVPDGEHELRTLSDFLLDVALLTDADNDDGDNDKVSMMTIHSAKGLEFPYVYVVGLEENLFPSQMALNSREELEEERRLFYVAVTRAEKVANLSFASTRYRWGNLVSSEPSRFIEEIDPQYVDLSYNNTNELPFISDGSENELKPFKRSGFSKTKPTKVVQKPYLTPAGKKNLVKMHQAKPSTPITESNMAEIIPGVEVKHEKFGKGKVLTVEGDSPNTKATVFFPGAGQKSLLLRFARLEVL